jgi:quinol monooxygenase YgiN
MSVLVIIDLRAKSGSADQLRAALNPAQVRGAAGNEGVDVAVNQEDAGNVVMTQRWGSREAYEAYRSTSDEASVTALVESMTVRVFDIVPRPARAGQGTRTEGLEDLEEWAKRWLGLRGEIRELNDAGLSNEHLGPVIRLHNEELDSIMAALQDAEGI